MHCRNCGSENPDGMTFCGTCGTALQQPCAVCGKDNPPHFQFCGHCGSPLRAAKSPGWDAQDAPVVVTLPTTPLSDGERRQLTVMFCDLVGSTALSLELDPEELREVIQSYQETCVSVIEEYAGYTAQYLGDGILAYFGYPVTREQEAERAVRAGLQILEAIEKLNRRLQKTLRVAIGVRISVHTGMVIVGQMGGGARHEHLALGTTPNVAARLQSLAEPGTLVISSHTYRLLRDVFTCEDLGPHSLKGVADPVTIYRVLGESEEAEDLSRPARHEIPLIGRRPEIELLFQRWQEAAAGRGQAVLVCGEPGIGKSNLIRNFQAQLGDAPYTTFVSRCEPHGQNSAFHAIIYLLQRVLNFYSGQSSAERLDMVEFMLEQNGISEAEGAPLLAGLLSIPTGERYKAADLRSKDVRTATQQVLLKLLLQASEEQPVLLVFEDLHWADPSTIELIGQLLDRIENVHLFALLTFRPTFQPPWPSRSHLANVTLNRLPQREAMRLVHSVTRGKDLPEDVLQEITRKTDGVPLFIEELTKMVLESGLLREEEAHYVLTGALPPLAIPASLQDSLMARLDRLSPVKELAQLGAAIGREFTYELIRAVSAMPDAALQAALDRLVQAELLYQQGEPPRASYVFKHALIQDAAYESLLKSRRQQYHQQIAQALASQFPDTASLQPELLGRHFTAAGLYEDAARYWRQAGEHAAEKSAYTEAIHHFSEGLTALSILEATQQRCEERLALLAGLGTAQIAIHGYRAAEVKQTFEQARALVCRVESSPYLTSAFIGLFAWHFIHGNFRAAESLASEMLAHAQQAGDLQAIVAANVAMGASLYMAGRLVDARRHLEEGYAHYRPGERVSVAFMGQDLGVAALCYLAHTLWALGYPDQARSRADEAVGSARALDHPHSLAFSLFFAATLAYHLRDHEGAAHRARELSDLAARYGFRHWQMEGALLAASIHIAAGDLSAAPLQIDQLLDENKALAGGDVPAYHPFLPEIYLRIGARDKALAYLRQALDETSAEGHTLWTPEMWRLLGEVTLLENPRSPDVETYFTRALDGARQEGARALELRAILSLAKLWQTDQPGKGRDLLQGMMPSLTEGEDTAELQEAKHLYQVLA